jgi:aryl-alcohol dehydrogenase-like predicted oxidoreductase
MMSFGDTSRRQWHLRDDEAEPIVRQEVEAGVTFFDTADMYDGGAREEVTGRLLAKLFSRREEGRGPPRSLDPRSLTAVGRSE